MTEQPPPSNAPPPPDDSDERISFDRATKQQIAEFPLEALQFFGREEGAGLTSASKITALQQELIEKHLGQGHRIVDGLLVVETPDGSRHVRVFLVEQTTRPGRAAVYQVAEYLFRVARWMEDDFQTVDIVPVIVFPRLTQVDTRIELRSERRIYGVFDCVACHLPQLDAEAELATDNVVAAANAMSMRYPEGQKVAVCARAIHVLNKRVADKETARRHCHHLLKCASMTKSERVELKQVLAAAEDTAVITTLFDDFRAEGRAEGLAEGEAKGEAKGRASAVLDVLAARGISLSDADRERIGKCQDVDELQQWLKRAMRVGSAAELFATH